MEEVSHVSFAWPPPERNPSSGCGVEGAEEKIVNALWCFEHLYK